MRSRVSGLSLGMPRMNIVIAALWYSPIAAALLVISAAVRRATVLWAVLPPMALGLLERSVLGTSHVFAFLGYRFTGFFDSTGGSMDRGPAATATP